MWKIAIIDDDRQVLQGMKHAIPWEELHAEWAGEVLNGRDGLDLIRSVCPDILITDIYMPVMNGLDMIECLREEQFNGKIIILSGYSDFEYARQALRLNVSDYLSKPISMPTLKEVLGRVIASLAEEEENRMKQDELQRRLMLYAPFVEKEWIKSAISGTLTGTYLQSESMPAPYRFWQTARHVVVGINIVRDIRVGAFSLSDLNLFRFAVRNIACEVTAERFSAFEYTELHGTHSALLIHPPAEMDERQTESLLKELGVKLIEAAASYLKLTLYVGLGGIKTDWRDIPDSTEEAFRAIEQREPALVAGYALYGSREGGQGHARSSLIRPVKFYQELAGAIKMGQETLANGIIDQFVAQLSDRKEAGPEYLKMLAREIWAILAYSMYEVGIVLDEIFPDSKVHQEWLGITRADQLSEWLKGKVSDICNSRQWRGNGKHRQAVDFMIQYIHENYNEDITLSDLADKVYISRNYLSYIFKNITGESFNSYLTRVRMEKAKELLMEHKMLVYEVAEKVGYQNVPYFSTLFKKYTGLKPTEIVRS